MKKFLIIFFLFSILVLIYLLNHDLSAKRVEYIPIETQKTKSKIEVTGWFSYFDEEKSAFALGYVFPYLNLFSPALYEVDSDGSLKTLTVKNKQFLLNEAKFHKLPIFPVIHDGGKREKLLKLLTDEDQRSEFVDSLIDEADQFGFKGFAIDFETLKSEDKADFVELSKYIYERLHQNDLEFHNILYGREENEAYDPAIAHDYKELAEVADRIYLMVYNYNNQLTAPGGQTPLAWYKKVLDYAVKSVPKEKLVIGLSGHGYQWTGSKIKGLSYWDVLDLILENNPQINFDEVQSAKTFTFQIGDQESVVYYDDSQAIIEKVKIAKNDYKLSNYAIWRIGAEDPKIWPDLINLD